MHSGPKSSFATFIPTNLVPIEPVNVTLSRRSIMLKKNSTQLKMSSCKHSGGHFYPNKNGDRSCSNLGILK